MDPPAPRELSAAERLDWLRLIRSENVGPITFRQLLRRFGSAQAALDALPDLARRGGRARGIAICSRAQAEREIAATATLGARLVALGEPDYPTILATIDDAPPLIGVMGHGALARRDMIAVIGARNASALGVRFARTIATELGRRGLIVVSGLARGIDAAAHDGALATGTIAVMGGGIDVIYPSENAELYRRIAEAGLIVAELPAGTEPKPQHFPRRNRLISGMARGVVVVEAGLRSGSLITARFALEQGREVFAVPGSPLDPRCHGANDLIRQGATLTENADDVMRVLAPILAAPLAAPAPPDFGPGPPAAPLERELQPARVMLLGLLGPSPVELDELVRQSGLSLGIVHMVLLELELAGRLARQPGNLIALV